MREPTYNPETSALKIAILYALLSSLWILFSDRALSMIVDRGLVIEISIIKGWVFVAITAAMLYVLVRRDVSMVSKSEARMRLLFDKADDVIYLFSVDEKGLPVRFLDVNSVAIQRLGYRREELLGMSPLDFIKPGLMDSVLEASDRRWREGQAVFETVMVGKDGTEIPVEINSRLIRTRGSVTGLSIARDITERRRAEAERRQTAMTTAREKRRFYRETIMAVTGGKFELGDPEDAVEWVRLSELSAPVRKASDLSTVRRSVVAYCREKGLSVQASADFELAIGEALANAVKHGGGGRVKAGFREGEVWVAVTDRGSGIDTFTLPQVALTPGFTTKASMGLGYTLILEVCDHVDLATGPSGTTVLMTKRIEAIPEIEKQLARHVLVE